MTFKSTVSVRSVGNRQFLGHRVARIGLLALAVFAAAPSQASVWSCTNLFQTEPTTTYGALRTEFNHNPSYSKDLTEQSEIRNQCALGTCHLHSWVSMLEQDHIADKREPILLSTHYLVAQYWLVQSLRLIRDIPMGAKLGAPISLQLGASVVGSRAMIQALGLIPDEAWTSRRDFQSAAMASRLTEAIQNIAGRTRAQYEKHPAEAQAILTKGAKEIIAVFTNVIGEVPEKFDFEGKSYTPQTFAKEFFPELHQPVVQMAINQTKARSTLIESDESVTTVVTNEDIVEQTAKRLIDEGHDVYLGYSHNSNYVDVKSGAMSLALVHMPRAGKPLNRELRDRYSLEDGGHAVQIVGYDEDPTTKKILKWKIKNSWGEAAGDHGYFHMYSDYFRAYARMIVFFRDGTIPLPTATIENAPKQLELPL